MRVGGMRHNVKILTKKSVKNEFKTFETTWSAGNAIKAQVRKNSGSLNVSRGEAFSSGNLTVEVWNHHNIKETNRIEWRGDAYQIDSINPSYNDISQVINVSKIND